MQFPSLNALIVKNKNFEWINHASFFTIQAVYIYQILIFDSLLCAYLMVNFKIEKFEISIIKYYRSLTYTSIL